LSVPTTRPRILITETDPVARALDAAAQRWPEDSNSGALTGSYSADYLRELREDWPV